jgi:cobalt-zinc-cadmium resistance protein CzcA
MIDGILHGAVRLRWLIIALAAVIACIGAWQLVLLPIDVTPDITNKQVQINTVVPTLTPVEIEKRVTYPIETAMAGLNGVERTRSFSRNGFSQVTVIFKEEADLYFMRQQVDERLAQARPSLPEGLNHRWGRCQRAWEKYFTTASNMLILMARALLSRTDSPDGRRMAVS